MQLLNLCSNYRLAKRPVIIVSARLTVRCVPFRLLLRILRQQQSSFVLQRTESTLQTADQVLQRLSPKETTLQALTEVNASLCPRRNFRQFKASQRMGFLHTHAKPFKTLSVWSGRCCQRTSFQIRWGRSTRTGTVWPVCACRASRSAGGTGSCWLACWRPTVLPTGWTENVPQQKCKHTKYTSNAELMRTISGIPRR